MSDAPATLRLDKWLWAARFFKTRSLAAQAVDGGKVHWQGSRAKPARELRVGDTLDIRIGDLTYTVTVAALSAQRGPAPQARLLYVETAQSVAQREAVAAQRQAAPSPGAERKGRPTKRDARRIHRFVAG